MSAQYAYDGSFPGLLCALCAALTARERPLDIVADRELQPMLLAPTIPITTDEEKADRFMGRIDDTMGRHVRRNLVRTFLSDTPGRELLIYDYLSFIREKGPNADGHLTHPAVAPVHAVARKVTVEAHRLTGMARFTRVAGELLVAVMEPRHRVLPLIAPHFTRRFPVDRWVMLDVGRGTGLYWDMKELHEVESGPETTRLLNTPPDSATGDIYEKMWRQYFKDIAIPERKNPRCQKRFMPTRYWKYLTEKR
ncbi:MAG TPA: TIGR03915 family putative DNA repair protein [bacterium]|nr:TIGR03915 family putative DNA repair protein [bacterium]